jgi:endonuclease G
MRHFRIPQELICVIFLLISAVTVADYVEVRRNAIIKQSPTSDGVPIHRAIKGEKYPLANQGEQENGYYEAVLPHTGQHGFVYRTLVRKHQGTLNIESPSSGNIGFDGEACHNHLIYGLPQKSDQIMCRDGYAIGYSYIHRTPDWVSYYITKESVHGTNVPRSESFKEDLDIPTEYRSGSTDYYHSGYDRGHIAPSASIDYSREANDETFLYSNMAPQLPGFNRNMMGYSGVWGAIEDKERKWVKARNILYIVAGTHFEEPSEQINDNVGIPTAFYKIIFDPIRVEAIAFWMTQDLNSAHKMSEYVKTIDEIEAITGLDFLDNLNDGIEALVEQNATSLNEWNE